MQSIKAAPEAVTLKSEAAGATAIKLTWNKVNMPSTGGGYAVYQVVNGADQLVKKMQYKEYFLYSDRTYTWSRNIHLKSFLLQKIKMAKEHMVELPMNLLQHQKLLPVTIDTIKSGKYNSVVLSWNVTSTGDEGRIYCLPCSF